MAKNEVDFLQGFIDWQNDMRFSAQDILSPERYIDELEKKRKCQAVDKALLMIEAYGNQGIDWNQEMINHLALILKGEDDDNATRY
jgi:hypothetical protein